MKHNRTVSLLLAACMLVPLAASLGESALAMETQGEQGTVYQDELYLASTPGLPASISVSKIKSVAKSFNTLPEEFLDELSGKKSISVETFTGYVKEYKLTAEFAQRFFPNHFVFKGGTTGLEFVPIKAGIAKNKYDWSNLKKYKSGEKKYVVDGTVKSTKGIDVSSHQGTIDWKKVKGDGVKFAFIRLGYRGYGTGKLLLDERFKANIKGAKAAGIKVGVYLYTQAINTTEALEEANLVINNLKGIKIDYPVVYDIEDAPSANARTTGLSKKQATANTKAFCEKIEDSGYDAAVYANTKWLTTRLDLTQLSGYDIWLAQYYDKPFYPYKVKFWQYSHTGRVKGIAGDVDMNIRFS